MLRAVEMLGGMTIRRAVTASDMAANKAQPQMYPTRTYLQAVFAAFGGRRYLLYLADVLAS